MEAIKQYRPSDVPSVLYKYVSWREHKDYEHNLLADNSAYFASAAHFNDPFDCNIKLRYDLADEGFRADVGKEYSKKVYPFMRRAERRKRVNPRAYAARFRKPEYKAAYEKSIYDYAYNQIGIFCMSEVNDNILMWAHYSNAHQGLCIGFNMDGFSRFCKRQYEERGTLMAPLKVGYVEIYPLLIPDPDNADDIAMEHLLTKALDWKHEKEFRLLYVGGTDVTFTIDDDIISEVIIGCRMDSSDQEQIIGLLSSRANRPRLFRTEPKTDSFGLDIKPMDY